MRGKITIRSVLSLTPEDDKEVTLRDTVLSGFEVQGADGRRGGLRRALPHRNRPGRTDEALHHRQTRLAVDGRDGAQPRRSGCSAWSRTARTRPRTRWPRRRTRRRSPNLPSGFSPSMPRRSARPARRWNIAGCSIESSCRRSAGGRWRT